MFISWDSSCSREGWHSALPWSVSLPQAPGTAVLCLHFADESGPSEVKQLASGTHSHPSSLTGAHSAPPAPRGSSEREPREEWGVALSDRPLGGLGAPGRCQRPLPQMCQVAVQVQTLIAQARAPHLPRPDSQPPHLLRPVSSSPQSLGPRLPGNGDLPQGRRSPRRTTPCFPSLSLIHTFTPCLNRKVYLTNSKAVEPPLEV